MNSMLTGRRDVTFGQRMNDDDIIESIKAEARTLAVAPNALAASGLKVSVEAISYEPRFGENPCLKVARHWYAAILPLLAETKGFEVVDTIDGEPILAKRENLPERMPRRAHA
jgi:hypothetical protein